jgi:hypothetical protein
MRRWVLATVATALVGLPTVLAFLSGGFFEKPRLASAALAWLLVIVVAFTSPRPLPSSTSGRVALVGLLLLCAWTAASIAWAPLAGRAQQDLQRLVLYLAYTLAAVGALREPSVRRWVEPSLAFGAFVVIGYGLAERLLPRVIDLDSSSTAVGRLEQPLTYWNAYGLLAAFGAVMALRVAGDPTRPRALRGAAAFVAVPLGLGLYLTFARGALGAAAIGVIVLIALAPQVRAQLRAIVTCGLATAVACAVASQLSTVKSLSSRDAEEGLLMLAVLIVVASAAALLAPRQSRRPLRAPALPVSRPATVLGVSVVALVAGGLLLAAVEGKPKAESPVRGANPERLASIDTNRYLYWEEAGRLFGDHPLVGYGSGGFSTAWLMVPKRFDASGDAHSLYLETAAELGVVGVLFLVTYLAGMALSVVRLYRVDHGAAAGVAAGLSVWAFHAGLDWDWEMPAVTLPALLLAAAAVSWSEGPEPEATSAATRVEPVSSVAAGVHLLGMT